MSRQSGWSAFWLTTSFLLSSAAWGWVPLTTNGRCLQSGLPCWTSIGNAGSNLGCCDPIQGNLPTCLQNNPCAGTHNYRWHDVDTPVHWYLNSNQMAGKEGYAKHSNNALENAAKQAWNAWTQPACTSFQHNYKGLTQRKPYWADQVVVLYLASSSDWAKLGIGGSVLAFSLPVANDKGLLRDGDIVFNPKPMGRNWGLQPVAQQEFDFVDVATHEVGHSIGFGHSESSAAVMYYSVRGIGPLFQGLSTDEEKAICATYPKVRGCTQNKTCGLCRQCNQGVCEEQSKRKANTCQACTVNQGCGAGSRCTQTAEGSRCLQLCTSSQCCPSGFQCRAHAGQSVCIPLHGSCPPLACQKDSDCDSGEACHPGTKTCQRKQTSSYHRGCQTSCTSNNDCGTNQTCLEISPQTRRCVQTCTHNLFCPRGFACQQLGKQHLCLPQNAPFCPCQNKTQCSAKESCIRGICQPSTPRTFGAPCNDKAACQTGLLCVPLSNQSVCAKSCDPSSPSAPTGTVGGLCRIDRSCDTGLHCQRMPSGPWLCLQRCQKQSDCSSGGSCTSLAPNQTKYCLCREDKECKPNGSCVNASSFASPPTLGACSQAASAGQCPKGSTCVDAGTSTMICLPQPYRQETETCDPLRRCKASLKCLPNPQKPQESRCLTTCQTSSECSKQGICLPFGNTQVCLCADDAHCEKGSVCDKSILGDKGLCKCNNSACKNCGDGTCDTKSGENCESCPRDCGCSTRQTCFQGKCTGVCGDQVCDPSENCTNCSDCRCPEGQECRRGKCMTYCANGTCDPGENCGNCSTDCACSGNKRCIQNQCVGYCGDGTCDPNENCNTCEEDCRCPQEKVCLKGRCQDKSQNSRCGNGICELSIGEGCKNCKIDCQCAATDQCVANLCRSIPEDKLTERDLPQPPDLSSQSGCGCDSTQNNPLLPLLLCLLILARMIHVRSAAD